MTRPMSTRQGKTHKVKVADVTAYITVNRDPAGNILEVFGKANKGEQGHLDMVCRIASLSIQRRGDVPTLIRHMRGDRTEPCGVIGQPTSIYDAIAQVLEKENAALTCSDKGGAK